MDYFDMRVGLSPTSKVKAKEHHFRSQRGPSSTTLQKKKEIAEHVEGRDDFDFNLEKERNSLFPSDQSLAFPIEHYSMMIEKVYVSFLKAYKQHYHGQTFSSSARNKSIMKVYNLGKRLQVFLKDIICKHIDYEYLNDKERIKGISSQVDEYLNTLLLDSEIELSPLSSGSHFDKGQPYFGSRVPDGIFPTRQVGRELNSIDKDTGNNLSVLGLAIDKLDGCSLSCTSDDQLLHKSDSSASTSYTHINQFNWNDCDCNDSVVGNGFIVTGWNENKTNFGEVNVHDEIWIGENIELNILEKNNIASWCNDEIKEDTNDKRASLCSDATDDFRFVSLISHRKEQERKWKEKAKNRV